MRVDFYHLTSRPPEAVLPRLLERVLQDGARALVVANDDAFLRHLDRSLWTYTADSFLPHGRAGSDGDADQPILLSETIAPANGATRLVIADGQWPDPAPVGFERIFYLFDPGRIDAARAAWRGLDGDRHYWKQDERGRWTEGP
jgi:DNA polymerase-3 subunit chi